MLSIPVSFSYFNNFVCNELANIDIYKLPLKIVFRIVAKKCCSVEILNHFAHIEKRLCHSLFIYTSVLFQKAL